MEKSVDRDISKLNTFENHFHKENRAGSTTLISDTFDFIQQHLSAFIGESFYLLNCVQLLFTNNFGHESRQKLRKFFGQWSKLYRHSSIYAVNVGTQKENRGSKNRVNRGYLLVLKGRKIGQNYKRGNSKIANIETVEIEECLYLQPKLKFKS